MENEKTNENLIFIQEYRDTAKTKLWKQYHVDQFGQKQGEEKLWYSNLSIGIIVNHKDGKWHGKFQDWRWNGTRWYIETDHFKKRKHGTRIYFNYENE